MRLLRRPMATAAEDSWDRFDAVKGGREVEYGHKLRIPTKPAMHSNRKPAIDSDLKPAGVPI
jgi:hypothetical protein